MPDVHDLFANKYKYRRCETSDIQPHFDVIKHWVQEEEHADFLQRMDISVDQLSAWCTENTFFYYTNKTPRLAHGVAIYGQEHSAEFLALISVIFSNHDLHTQLMQFVPHPGKNLEEYKTLVTRTSLERFHWSNNRKLMINIENLRKKIVPVYRRWRNA